MNSRKGSGRRKIDAPCPARPVWVRCGEMEQNDNIFTVLTRCRLLLRALLRLRKTGPDRAMRHRTERTLKDLDAILDPPPGEPTGFDNAPDIGRYMRVSGGTREPDPQ